MYKLYQLKENGSSYLDSHYILVVKERLDRVKQVIAEQLYLYSFELIGFDSINDFFANKIEEIVISEDDYYKELFEGDYTLIGIGDTLTDITTILACKGGKS